MRDLYNDFKAELGMAAAAKAKASSPFAGEVIDLKGYEGLRFDCIAGALGNEINTYTFSLTECDTSNGTFTDVNSGDILGTYPVFTKSASVDNSNTVKSFGYIGKKRYVKLSLVVAGSGNGNGVVGAVAVKGRPRHAPAV